MCAHTILKVKQLLFNIRDNQTLPCPHTKIKIYFRKTIFY